MTDEMTAEQAKQILADANAAKMREFGIRLEALQREFGVRLQALPQYTRDGRTVAVIQAVDAEDQG